ncbi:MAG: S8 family serine peptidase, partial [Candidatus Dormibacteraceae bacterium]
MNVEFQPGKKKPAAHDLADGSGVKVGVIADGLDINNSDLQRNGKSIVYDYKDFSGYGNDTATNGEEAFLDAGAIAAQGNTTYDLSKFVNRAHPLSAPCNIRIKGVAPGVSLAMFNVIGSSPSFFNSQIVQAIDRAVLVDKVDVLNESFGSNSVPDTTDDVVAIADQNAVAAGVTVVASSGDDGPTNTIVSPASNPGIIAVGGSTTFRVYRQTTRYGTQLKPGGWLNNNITALSSAGTTQFGPRTVDVVAPGDRGWTPCSLAKQFTGCPSIDNGTPQPIWAAGGTSASAPLTSGTAALVIQAYARTHGGVHPSPALVKQIIVSSATDLNAPADHQGAGLVNTLKAVQLAESIGDAHGSPVAQGSRLLLDQTSLSSIKEVGFRPTYKLGVTNQGSKRQTVKPT